MILQPERSQTVSLGSISSRAEKGVGFLQRSANFAEWADDDILIAVVGNSGSGKTTFINTAAEVILPVSHDLRPCTKEMSATRIFIPGLTDCAIVLIDTPGLDVTNSDPQIVKNVGDKMKALYGRKKTLSGILCLQPIYNTKELCAGSKLWLSLQATGTKASLPPMRLVTTMWNEMKETEFQKNEKKISSRWTKLVGNPHLLCSRFEMTHLSALSILLPFIQSANRSQSYTRFEEARLRLRFAQVKPEPSQEQFKELSNLAEKERVIFTKISNELEKSTPDIDLLERLVKNHKSLRSSLRAKIEDLQTEYPLPVGSVFSPKIPKSGSDKSYSNRIAAVKKEMKKHSLLPDAKVVLLLGSTGSGKSQFIQDCLSSGDKQTNGPTERVNAERQPIELVPCSSRDAFFIDTPGFISGSNNRQINTDLSNQITIWLDALKLKRVRLTGVVFLHQVSIPLEERDFLVAKPILSACLSDRIPVVLATTHWDQEDGHEARGAPDCWKGLIDLGSLFKKLGRRKEQPITSYETTLDIFDTLVAASTSLDSRHSL